MADLVAAVDCGTNTIRLLISGPDGDVVRRQTITRLGAGVDRTGRLDPAALDRTIAELAEHRRLLDEHGVEAVRVAATSAARSATNRDELLDRAEATLGVRPEILPGDEEGRLSFAGATAGLDPSRGPFCVVDIGGGSTEFAYGTTELERVLSVEMGSVRFTERFVESDPPEPEELVACLSVAEAHLADVQRELPELADVRTWIGVAGTVTTVAAVELGCGVDEPGATHHFELTHDAAEDVFRTLVTEPLEDRRFNPGLHPDRAEVIVGGSAILVAIMRSLHVDPLLVSERDLLDGLAASLR
ncbi:Ppx/GppA phosphatase family protein [Actinomarinicola tropica]|uniref:Ppx/GppA phosphatase family protein n=1 Tax=Actinomarinicola tropica TaxID=2789776 RepID=UPI001898E8CA|nr:exopolyphosphatase [Actinomarinicola tropica]